jgi:AcrR family transcriptional regulator
MHDSPELSEARADDAGSRTFGRRRGRPQTLEGRRVYAALLEAAEDCLERKAYADITLREVAAAAGVNPAMVNYYFGGKEGLFIALVEYLFGDWAARLKRIDAASVAPSPTRCFVLTVRDCFYRHRAVLWLIDHEMGREDSAFRSAFHDRLASASTHAIRRFLARMAESGVFRAAADLRFLSYSVAALTIFPIVFARRLQHSYGIAMDELDAEPWLTTLEHDLDRLLRP